MQTAQISNKATAIVPCSKCRKTKAVDVSHYLEQEKNIEFIVQCDCGNGYTAFVEKRKQHRLKTDLQGTFVHLLDEKEIGRGVMTVCDLSLSGIKLKVNVEHSFAVGDILQLEFKLDDIQKSLIQKKVVIRHMHLPFIGTEFYYKETIEKALGYYLFK